MTSTTKTKPSDQQPDRLVRAHVKLARTLRSTHYGHHVREYTATGPPTGIEFAKHVGNNTPFLVRGFAAAWPALSSPRDGTLKGKWTNDFLMQTMGETKVSVAVTGDGRADAVVLVEEGGAADIGEEVAERCVKGLEMSENLSTVDDNVTYSSNKNTGCHIFVTPYTAQLPFTIALSYILSTQRQLPIPNTPSHITSSKPCTPNTISTTSTTTERTESNTPHQPIIYLQAQNDCLRSEYPRLLDHLPMTDLHPPWITDVLGEAPEAINLWIGTKHSVSTMHSDPYENIYVVIRGSKTFVLAPPGEAWFYSKSWFGTGEWVEGTEYSTGHTKNDHVDEIVAKEVAETVRNVTLKVSGDSSDIPWYPVPHPLHISADLLERYPRLKYRPKPYTVTVHAGDMVYLPRAWLHHVEQEDEDGLCVAVNSWFEGWDGGMGRDWGIGHFMDSVDAIVNGREEDEETSEDEEEHEGDEVVSGSG